MWDGMFVIKLFLMIILLKIKSVYSVFIFRL